MTFRAIPHCLAFFLCTMPLLAAAPPPELSSKFDAASAYGVPGIVLPPGSFSIEVVGHLGKRYIVHVEDQIGDVLATFLGIPSATLGHANGKVNWPTKAEGITYLRGWYFPSASLGLEFVYPKADAVALAQANHASVAAIDPASDGLLESQPRNISAKDLQVVTLWILTPTRVGANHAAGIEAKRYEQPANLATQVASAAPARPATTPAPHPNAEPQVAGLTPHRRPALRVLPHTASNQGSFYLAGIFSFAGALGLRIRRARSNA